MQTKTERCADFSRAPEDASTPICGHSPLVAGLQELKYRKFSHDLSDRVSGRKQRGPENRITVAWIKLRDVVDQRKADPCAEQKHRQRLIFSGDKAKAHKRKKSDCPHSEGLP